MKTFRREDIRNMATLKKPPSKVETKTEDIDAVGLRYLENLGCSVVEGYSADTTLLSENIDTITNPNIRNQTITKNNLTSAEKNFANENDPFYSFSEKRSTSKANDSAVKTRTVAAKQVSTLVNDLNSMNRTTQSSDNETQTRMPINSQTNTNTTPQRTSAINTNKY